MRKLGCNQAGLLRSLVDSQSREGAARWTLYCGWVWSTQTQTQKMFDQLVKRGLVRVHIEKNDGTWSLRPAEYPVYTPTDAGRAWVKENPR